MSIRVKNKKGIIGKIFKLLLNVAISFVCVIALLLIYYVFMAQIHANDEDYKPGFSFYTIVSPSMNPVIKVYDVIVNVKVNNPEDIKVGDIITYVSTNSTSLGMTITHRVIAVYKNDNGNYEYQTQGDNNSEPDSVLVTFDHVIGKKLIIIPALGKLQFLMANKKNWLFLLLIPIAFFIFKDLYELLALFGLRKKVDTITGENLELDYKPDVEEIEKRKETIRRELNISDSKTVSVSRSSKEPEGFLEPYTEIILTIGKEEEKAKVKDVSPIKVVKTDKIDSTNQEKEKKIEKEDLIVPNIDIEKDINEQITGLIPIVTAKVDSNIEKSTEPTTDIIDELVFNTEPPTVLIEKKVREEKEIETELVTKDLPTEKEDSISVIEGISIEANTDDEKLNKEITELAPVISPVEILDTDELTEKIKTYDDKINKLNEMLESLESLKINKIKEIEEEKKKAQAELEQEKESAKAEIVAAKESARREIQKQKQQTISIIKDDIPEMVTPKDEDNFLVGGPFKVINIEVAQKKRGRSSKKINDEVLLKTSVIPKIITDNKPSKKNDKANVVIKNDKLNLKDKKKVQAKNDYVATDEDLLEEINRFYKKEDKELMFNPKIIKTVEKKEKNKKSEKVKKKGFIYFEKVKNKGN